MAIFRVQASLITVRGAEGVFKGWRTAEQLPTFYVEADDADRATLVAARLVLAGRRATDPVAAEVAGTVIRDELNGPPWSSDYRSFKTTPAEVE